MNYLQLTSIPLFTGISGEDLALIMDRVEMVEFELRAGKLFVAEGETCQCMAILRHGTIRRCSIHEAGSFTNTRHQQTAIRYKVEETLEGPLILEPEVLFGLDNKHKSTWTAEGSCQFTLIGKEDIRMTLMYVPVWRINYINMLCTELQRSKARQYPETNASGYTQSLIQFILRHASPKSQSLTFHITNEMLGELIGANRIIVTKTLKQLQEEGLIESGKKYFHVPSTEKLLNRLNVK